MARRYRRLRAGGVLRVVGVLDGSRLGERLWVVRVRCTPDVAGVIADALAGRADTSSVQVLAGGTEVGCRVSSGDEVLDQELPWARGVLGVSAHEVLSPAKFVAARWGPLEVLDAEQIARLRRPAPDSSDGDVVLGARDRRLVEGLGVDGRATYAELGKRTGWSQSTVARRLEYLRRTGVLRFQVEVPPQALGYQAEAWLWMVVKPEAIVATAEALAGQPEISSVAVTTGATNLVAQVICWDSAYLYRFLTEQVAGLPGVASVDTAPVLRTVKRVHSTGPDG
ncbi:Lrp/AsnC ligand binding domain-containing protein [Kribbella sp. CA-247076]|uniref:Lrp/AsnC ligand binding domain-containing protein n=1 Tax=Kribbella sp. CA-247076 TaxID=3239941 RepID=UPI003D8F8AEE